MRRSTNVKVAAIAAIAAAGLMAASCGASKQAAYTTPQKAASNRGVKLEKEECEALAMESVKGWRDFGNGVSAEESFARNIAELDARSRLANQLQAQVNTLIRSFGQQHKAGGASDLVGKSTEIQESYADQLLTGVKVICANTYVREDGSYNIYVCVEMSEQSTAAIYKKLTADQKLSIDFSEHQFRQEMEKAKEDYRRHNR
jgi:hypothetical protein